MKNSEGKFIWELENSYELSPKLSTIVFTADLDIKYTL